MPLDDADLPPAATADGSHAPGLDVEGHRRLLAHARYPDDPATRALAGVMALAHSRPAPYGVPIHGLGAEDWQWLSRQWFCGLDLGEGRRVDGGGTEAPLDEFEDLVDLLLRHATPGQDVQFTRCLAHAVATACMGSNHLWQDLGFEDRNGLSALMRERFAPLKALNAQDMRWKKFFYRSLCEAAEVLICKSPSCMSCSDQPACFGVEAGQPLLPSAVRFDGPRAA